MASGEQATFVSPETNYLNLDDIIASQARLPCKVELPVYRLGFLDPSTKGADLLPSTKLELPCWLALNLCNQRRHIVSVELPKYYREAYREIVTADASAVDFYKLGPYYYKLGLLLLRFGHVDHKLVARTLQHAFLNRFKMIMDRGQNSVGGNVVELMQRFDEDERQLFLSGFSDVENGLRWQSRESEKIRMSNFVNNQRKRKHAEMEASSSRVT